ncbi:ATP-binding cassette domain-containing protein [Halomonas sp. Bachu 37]|uniref:ABC transporter ATP-binding protein n=1 Tax=Halomonas kashgarensis TaxID=3084920 RepID=UPI003216B155
MLEAERLQHRYSSGPSVVAGVSLTLKPGEWVGLSGESGAGKTTLGKLLAGHFPPRSGSVTVAGKPLPRRGLSPVQWLPQAPELAVNPRWKIKHLLNEAWHPDPATRRIFGIDDAWLERRPHQLSGGELQRITVVRALAPGVRYLVADEISAMLDPLSQVELWQALRYICTQRQIGILVISHDTALLDRLCLTGYRMAAGRLSPRLPTDDSIPA